MIASRATPTSSSSSSARSSRRFVISPLKRLTTTADRAAAVGASVEDAVAVGNAKLAGGVLSRGVLRRLGSSAGSPSSGARARPRARALGISSAAGLLLLGVAASPARGGETRSRSIRSLIRPPARLEAEILMVEPVPELVALRLEVAAVLVGRLGLDRHLLDDGRGRSPRSRSASSGCS